MDRYTHLLSQVHVYVCVCVFACIILVLVYAVVCVYTPMIHGLIDLIAHRWRATSGVITNRAYIKGKIIIILYMMCTAHITGSAPPLKHYSAPPDTAHYIKQSDDVCVQRIS